VLKTGDALVDEILTTVERSGFPPHERKHALITAGLLAQAYVNEDSELLASVFGSDSQHVLQNDRHEKAFGVGN
jgi:hypothetical protein